MTQMVAADSVPSFDVCIFTGKDALATFEGSSASRGFGTSPHDPFAATVLCVKELHQPASDRSCLHVELDTTGSAMDYEAGDHVGIYAQNSMQVVEEAARLLGLSLDTTFSLSLPDGNPHQLSLPFKGVDLSC